MNKRLTIILIFVLISILCLVLVGCNEADNQSSNLNGNLCGDPPPKYCTDKTMATSFISIDINPSIELTLNYDNKVLSAYGANDDGKVLLYGEDDIVGEPVETAIKKITELAVELGYLSDENDTVQTYVSSIDSIVPVNQEKIGAQIIAVAQKLVLSINVQELDTYSLNRKFKEFQADNEDNFAIRSLSLGEFKMLSSAAEANGITINEAISLDKLTLLQTISKGQQQAKPYETEEYIKEYSIASDIYEKALDAVTDGIYTSYYMLHHPFRAYYGLAYEGYKLTARGLNAIANGIDYICELRQYPLDESQIESIIKILGLENANALKNAEGNVTVKSIEAYANKKFKETEFSASLEEMKNNLTATLKTIECAIQTKIDELAQKYAPELEVISNSLSSIVNGIKDFESILPQVIQSAIQDFSDLVVDLANVISDFKITVAEIRDLSDKAFAKSESALTQIKNDLSDEELAEIAEIQKSAIDSIENAKKQFEDAIKGAKQSAEAYLQELKNQRKAA